MNLPKQISPCPVVDALVEFRFSTDINPNAVFGIIYNALRKDYAEVLELPILQIPEPIRASDPNLKFKPHFKISNRSFSIQIGPDVISISSFPTYTGWDPFYAEIIKTLLRIDELGIISQYNRVGIRYINFFENCIFDKIALSISINESNIKYKNTSVKTEIEHQNFTSTLQVSNSVTVNNRPGSIIDIDTFKTLSNKHSINELKDILNEGHLNEKGVFFELLKVDFLSQLNPQY